MSLIIISNNYLIKEKDLNCEFIDGDYIDVLLRSRDLIHLGYSLVNHPLPASIRMVFSPVRSIILKKGSNFDENSSNIMETSIEKYRLTMKNRNIDYKNKEDYQLVDQMLMESALEEHKLLSGLDI